MGAMQAASQIGAFQQPRFRSKAPSRPKSPPKTWPCKALPPRQPRLLRLQHCQPRLEPRPPSLLRVPPSLLLSSQSPATTMPCFLPSSLCRSCRMRVQPTRACIQWQPQTWQQQASCLQWLPTSLQRILTQTAGTAWGVQSSWKSWGPSLQALAVLLSMRQLRSSLRLRPRQSPLHCKVDPVESSACGQKRAACHGMVTHAPSVPVSSSQG